MSRYLDSLSLDISSLTTQYQKGMSPVEVIRTIYKRIAVQSDNPIWIALLPEDEVLKTAEALLEKEIEALPLFGIPFAVKDNIDVAGIPTTAGCPGFSYVPERHATVVQKLLSAGALLIGKTNLDQFATGLVGTRSPYGACRNVFNPEYISGGSSSGSAVAVAAGLVSFALGTDTAGSGRVPAAFNNIVGLKPTRGLLSTSGVVPACRSLDCVSVFALTCLDAQRILAIAQGFDSQDGYSRRPPEIHPGSVTSFHFGVPASGELNFFADEEYRLLFEQSVPNLEAIGGIPVEINFAPFRETAQLLYSGPWIAERYGAIQTFLTQHPDQILPVTREILNAALGYSASDVFSGFHRLEELRQLTALEWEKMDILALPTTGTIYKIQDVEANPLQLNNNLGYYTNFLNLLDLSAIALPAGFRNDGLPFGITLIAPAFHERQLCSIGSAYHQVIGGMGATAATLPVTNIEADPNQIQVAVVGAHLTGQPLNHQLTSRGAKLLKTTHTAPIYKFYALTGTTPPKPGLIRLDGEPGHAIEVEVWEMPHTHFGSFMAEIPSPLGIGTLLLETGESVLGFICETYAVASARDISSYGGWRAYLASL